MGGVSVGDIHQLSEQHQFILLLIGLVAQIVGMVLLWKSSPDKKVKPQDGNAGQPVTDPVPPASPNGQ